MQEPLSILYTHNLRGDLAMLPRLYTLLRQLRAQAQRFEDEDDVLVCALQPPARRTLLIDLGNSCAANVWHCAATGGRSTLILLDAMGYDAAHVTRQLAPGAREKLVESVQMVLVDGDHAYEQNGVQVTAARQPGLAALQLVAQPDATARLDGRVLYPQALEAGQVGVAHVSFRDGSPRLSGHDVFPLSPGTPPEPTIAGAVDFVLSEAKRYQAKQAR
mgnify:CR=1 FL=1